MSMNPRDLCGCFGRRSRPPSVASSAIPRYSTLCNRCKALDLDDVAIGGFASGGEDGQEYLKLGADDRYRHIDIDYYRHDIYPALLNIRKSASDGCEFCELLQDSILSPAFEKALAKDDVDTSAAFYFSIKLNYGWRVDNLPDGYEKNRGLASLEARLTIEYEERLDCSYTFRFAIESTPTPHNGGKTPDSSLAAQKACEKWLRLRLNETGYILTEERVAWLKGEVDRFTEEHNPPPQPSFIPTRLIQVDCDIPRLVRKDDISKSRTEPVRYAALSYYWGNKEEALSQYKTTKSTLAARLSGFEARNMTKVLCDAIQTTRALSLSYLWVDALCIIQDDGEDWEKESIQMGRIYEHAHVTFFTLSSNSCLQGFLERPPPRLRIPFRSRINPLIAGAWGVRLINIDSNWSGTVANDDSYIEKDLETSNWGTRGWTYQEQALSKACIWFGGSRMHFLCPEWSYTEGDGTPSRAIPHFQLESIYAPDKSPDELCWSWYANVVEQFTARLFTNQTDLFPAISGLAQNFHRLLGGDYLAGIWMTDLHKGLWFSCVKQPAPSFPALVEQLARPAVYIAPSWSWAPDIYLRPYVKGVRKAYRKIEKEMTLAGVDQFGRLKGGSLKVTGRICQLQLSPDRVRNSEFPDDGELVADSEDRAIFKCECDWAGSLIDVGDHVVLLLLGHTQRNCLRPLTTKLMS
ncbi:heterokaryon incompatibility protein-domain-containing protein [Annulohypoxylon bovei var. microspora]|nr:heterokaryon incompatibility protein-domain-containing protein [Annulohypoxylon bovei var. microspora]